MPPDQLIRRYAGGMSAGRFISAGDLTVAFLARRAGLRSDTRMLDLGCGCGQIARALVDFLAPAGRYDGLDVGREAIEWCRNAFAAVPNFRFWHADLRSTCYNPDGVGEAADYVLPFERAAFDLVYLGSVFTHLLPDQVAQYLREIARVMKPSGTCLATFYLLDDESRANNDAGRTEPRFTHDLADGCRVRDPAMPEAAVAYEESLVRRLYAESGLAISGVRPGEWGHGELQPQMQDMVWARVTSPAARQRAFSGHPPAS